MPSINFNPLVQGVITQDESFNARYGLVQSFGGGDLWYVFGVPPASLGQNGDYALRQDTPGTVNQRLYVKSAGAWSGIL